MFDPAGAVLAPFLSQDLRRDSFQFRGDLLQGRGEAYLSAEADRHRIRVGLHSRCRVCRRRPGLPLFRGIRASGQSLPRFARFVHHSVVQAHEERASIRYGDAIQGGEPIQQNAKALRDVVRNLAQPSRRGGRRFRQQFRAAMQTADIGGRFDRPFHRAGEGDLVAPERTDGPCRGRASEASGKQIRTVRTAGNREVVSRLESGEFALGDLAFSVDAPIGQRLQLAEQLPGPCVGGFDFQGWMLGIERILTFFM
jgi:hypothetical protein